MAAYYPSFKQQARNFLCQGRYRVRDHRDGIP